MSEVSHWMHVDVFTVEQAAALWCGTDPAKLSPVNSLNRSEILAVKQMLSAAIVTKEMPADTSTNGLAMIGEHSKSLVTRASLEAFARQKNLFPAFLFDTLLPFDKEGQVPSIQFTPASLPLPDPPINRGGRPPEYDWDRFTMEIIRKANTPGRRMHL
ncbi:hypothetical protein [Rhizobium sp. AG855]|uniref:hypothetical protein n=1 Tax=Rhizobium sp. AG855 TaxID=2183898 RepID=UPI000E71A2C8|nr:hypothetical protein [Rhizobium sp. AG855]RKE78297.1 hypothetical protein DFO46_4467 [Rhizobium sp. AG855]